MVRKGKTKAADPRVTLREIAELALEETEHRLDAAVLAFMTKLEFTPMQLALAGGEIKARARRYLTVCSANMGVEVNVRAHKRQKPALPRSLVAAAVAHTLGILHTFKINGQPIANVTVREARAWASSQQRNASWVCTITDDLDDDMIVGDHVDEKWAQLQYDAMRTVRPKVPGARKAA